MQLLARDGRVPRWLRGLAAFGVLPIPGPLDEVALLIVGVLLWAFYRETLRDAWRRAGSGPSGADSGRLADAEPPRARPD